MIQMEIGFNVVYLLSIYLIVGLMFHRNRSEIYINQPGSVPFLWAFFLLMLGDTGHVGFRLLAFASGGLEQNEVLVGLGALATAVTITIFYMLMLEAIPRIHIPIHIQNHSKAVHCFLQLFPSHLLYHHHSNCHIKL